MKMKIIVPLLLAMLFSVGSLEAKNSVTEKSKIESVVVGDAITAANTQLEVKEHYKIDSSEYIGAIASKGEGLFTIITIASFLGILALLYNRFKDLVTFKRFALSGLFMLGLAIMFFYPVAGVAIAMAGAASVDDEDESTIVALGNATKMIKDIKKDLGDKADKQEIKDLLKSVNDLKSGFGSWDASKIETTVKSINEGIEKLVKQVEEMSEDVQKSKENRSQRDTAGKTFGQLVVEALKEGADLTKPLNKGEHRKVEVKANINKVVGNMGTGNVTAVGTNAIPYELSDFQLGLTRIVRRSPYLLQIANVSSTNKMYVQWAEQANPDGAANETAQGSVKNQIDFDWVEKSAKVEKITAYIKVSKEALDDLDGLANEIDTELRETILIKVDTDLLSGDGTTPSLNGLLNQDTAYSAGAFAGTISEPNEYDVIRTAIAQVVTNLFIPNYIIMHPTDVAKLDLTKGSDGHYSIPPFKSADGMVISGVRIIENTGQTVDKFTVGDFTKFNVRIREGLTIDMGLDGNDFTYNLITILGEIRLVAYVKTNHVGAFVSGDFSDAIAALDSGS